MDRIDYERVLREEGLLSSYVGNGQASQPGFNLVWEGYTMVMDPFGTVLISGKVPYELVMRLYRKYQLPYEQEGKNKIGLKISGYEYYLCPNKSLRDDIYEESVKKLMEENQKSDKPFDGYFDKMQQLNIELQERDNSGKYIPQYAAQDIEGLKAFINEVKEYVKEFGSIDSITNVECKEKGHKLGSWQKHGWVEETKEDENGTIKTKNVYKTKYVQACLRPGCSYCMVKEKEPDEFARVRIKKSENIKKYYSSSDNK